MLAIAYSPLFPFYPLALPSPPLSIHMATYLSSLSNWGPRFFVIFIKLFQLIYVYIDRWSMAFFLFYYLLYCLYLYSLLYTAPLLIKSIST